MKYCKVFWCPKCQDQTIRFNYEKKIIKKCEICNSKDIDDITNFVDTIDNECPRCFEEDRLLKVINKRVARCYVYKYQCQQCKSIFFVGPRQNTDMGG